MLGIFNRARQNWEGIVYAIVSIFLLERVRIGWNRIERAGKKDDIGIVAIRRRQHIMLVKASLLYALPLLLPVVKYIYRSVEELSWSVPGLLVLKNTTAFFSVVVVTEVFLAIVVYNLLRVYIERLNSAASFFQKLGRNVWDGSIQAVQAGVRASVNAGVRASASVGARLKHHTLDRASTAWRKSKVFVRRTPLPPMRGWRRARAERLQRSHA